MPLLLFLYLITNPIPKEERTMKTPKVTFEVNSEVLIAAIEMLGQILLACITKEVPEKK